MLSLFRSAGPLSIATMFVISLLSACGGDSERGKTSCGITTCNAGQYCLNLACIPGCQSNENCALDQTCEDIGAGTHVGTCQNKNNPPTMMTTDPTCKTTCDKLVQCGLFTWDEGVVCQTGCEKWTTDQKKVTADCAAAWTCSGTTAPSCLGAVCGGKYQCKAGSCVQHSCI
ncbi:MAG TPA: hypothetical protein PLA87_15520 [Pseudomonadota bacterium]|jgi:hypothetical protein|nr:hypothetical protein [Pseudomonadota bacterium]